MSDIMISMEWARSLYVSTLGIARRNLIKTGCAVDIRVLGMEQLIRYATILLDYADETNLQFDELLIERNRYGAIWLHFAVRPFSNRRKVCFINA